MLAGRRIVVGITGGIAAYKSAYLARRLMEEGADLRVVMTAAAEQFVGRQTLAAIAGRPVEDRLFDAELPVPHTDLGRWAELVVVAPATADAMAKLAAGLGDDLLTTTLLATRAPVLLAPAMHTEMWEHPATRRNLDVLRADGHHIVGPETGPLTGGDSGPGRMSEPEDILMAAAALLGPADLTGWRVLVTAGGTREPIDPVRYVGNRSSGKMGLALAREAARRGADVTLVTTVPEPAGPGIDRVEVETAADMAESVWSRSGDHDVVVMAAAVADFRPKDPSGLKLPRLDGPPELHLEPTPDVLGGLAQRRPRPFLVGFAAETGSLERALDKARSKGVDLLVANDVSRPGSGFGSDSNEVTLVYPDGTTEPWELAPKRTVASRLWDRIRELREED